MIRTEVFVTGRVLWKDRVGVLLRIHVYAVFSRIRHWRFLFHSSQGL